MDLSTLENIDKIEKEIKSYIHHPFKRIEFRLNKFQQVMICLKLTTKKKVVKIELPAHLNEFLVNKINKNRGLYIL